MTDAVTQLVYVTFPFVQEEEKRNIEKNGSNGIRKAG